jgi:glutamyl-tRNA synthetase
MSKVITRFPPSPTGYFHIGNARTALFNYLFAKSQGGEMILRIEDTDKERSETRFEKDILEGLEWLGISYDNKSIPRQSERTEVYKEYLQKLINDGLAYISKEEEGERDEVIRFKNPNVKIKFNDLIRGEVEFDTTDLKDFVIAKSIDEPIYHLTVVIDDNEMGITHVIRGEDHISNTPRQILIQEALGFERLIYAHLPLILGPDKSKLASRHGAVSVSDYKKDYLSEALVNYLALLGWNPGDEREIFTMDELIAEFSIEKVQKGGAIFSAEKLDWINKQHLDKLSDKEFLTRAGEYIPEELKNYQNFAKALPLLRERVSKFSDMQTLVDDGEFDFYINEPEMSPEKLEWKDEGREKAKENLVKVISLIENLENFSYDSVKSVVQPFADEKGRGSVMHPMRLALTGRDKSPDPFTVAGIIGKEATLRRLKTAINKLESAT